MSDQGYSPDLWYRIRTQCVEVAGLKALQAYLIDCLQTHPSPPVLDEQRVWEIMQPAMGDRDAIDMMAHNILDPDGESPVERRERYAAMFRNTAE